MAEKNWKQPITEEEFKANSVSELADRPNQPAAYGVGGLSATALKEWFDKTAVLLKDKLNDLIAAVSDKEFFRDLQVDFGDVINAALAVNGKKIENFYDLVEAIEDGTLARCALMVQDPVGGLISIESSIGKIYEKFVEVKKFEEIIPKKMNALYKTLKGRLLDIKVDRESATQKNPPPKSLGLVVIKSVEEDCYAISVYDGEKYENTIYTDQSTTYPIYLEIDPSKQTLQFAKKGESLGSQISPVASEVDWFISISSVGGGNIDPVLLEGKLDKKSDETEHIELYGKSREGTQEMYALGVMIPSYEPPSLAIKNVLKTVKVCDPFGDEDSVNLRYAKANFFDIPKSGTGTRIPCVFNDGSHGAYGIDNVNRKGKIPVYTDNTVYGTNDTGTGYITTAVPVYDYHCANKKYVDDQISLLREEFSTMTKGKPQEVATASEMDAVLENADENTVGKVYRYTGETTDKYTNGELYIVEGAE